MTTYFFEIYTNKDADGVWNVIRCGHVFARDLKEALLKIGARFGAYDVIDIYESSLAPIGLEAGDHYILR